MKKSVIVKLCVFVCVFRLALYCVSTTFPLLSLISMHGESWVHTPSFEKLTVCVLMSSTSVFQGLHPHFLLVLGIQQKNKGRQESSEGSGVFLSHSVWWGLLKSLTKDQKKRKEEEICCSESSEQNLPLKFCEIIL